MCGCLCCLPLLYAPLRFYSSSHSCMLVSLVVWAAHLHRGDWTSGAGDTRAGRRATSRCTTPISTTIPNCPPTQSSRKTLSVRSLAYQHVVMKVDWSHTCTQAAACMLHRSTAHIFIPLTRTRTRTRTLNHSHTLSFNGPLLPFGCGCCAGAYVFVNHLVYNVKYYKKAPRPHLCFCLRPIKEDEPIWASGDAKEVSARDGARRGMLVLHAAEHMQLLRCRSEAG